MNNYQNPFIRLQFYNTYLINDRDFTQIFSDYDYGFPISKLAELSSIPLQVIRNDILVLFQWYYSVNQYSYNDTNKNYKIRNQIEFIMEDPEYERINAKYHIEELNFNDKNFYMQFETNLLNGTFDLIPIHIIRSENETKSLLHLTSSEAEALYSINNSEISNSTISNLVQSFERVIHIKDSYLSNHNYETLYEKLSTINDAIESNNSVYITYHTNHKGKKHLTIHPLKISFDTNENQYSVISIDQNQINVYRIDQILEIKILEKDDNEKDDSKLDIAPHVWGNCFRDSPIKVKVKFYNEANVWEKVKKDLGYRNPDSLYEKDGFLYYEDTIYGINKFRSWIFGYGKSAILLSPKSEIDKIIKSLNCRKTNQ